MKYEYFETYLTNSKIGAGYHIIYSRIGRKIVKLYDPFGCTKDTISLNNYRLLNKIAIPITEKSLHHLRYDINNNPKELNALAKEIEKWLLETLSSST